MSGIRIFIWLLIAGFLTLASGCETAPTAKQRIDAVRIENKELTRQIEEAKKENQKLKEQLKVISDAGPIRAEMVYDLKQVTLTKYTNLYDKNKDGQFETLCVYIQPMDSEGDIIKAAGSADVELWDLSRKAENAKLGQWSVTPEEMKKLWFAAFSTNYRLSFDIAGPVKKYDHPLTVKVTFTDYLTGKVFKEEVIIKPRG